MHGATVKFYLLMSFKVEVHTEQSNAVWAPFRIVEC